MNFEVRTIPGNNVSPMSFVIHEFEQFFNNSGLADVLAGKIPNGNAELEAAKQEI